MSLEPGKLNPFTQSANAHSHHHKTGKDFGFFSPDDSWGFAYIRQSSEEYMAYGDCTGLKSIERTHSHAQGERE